MSTDPNAPVNEGLTPAEQNVDSVENPAGQVVDQQGNVQVTDETPVVDGVAVPDNERPLDKDGHALVPGTPDEQIVADRTDGDFVQTDATKSYADDVDSIVEKLGELAARLGQDLSDAVLSDVKSERQAGINLRLALEAVLDAQRAVAAVASISGAVVGVNSGVVGV